MPCRDLLMIQSIQSAKIQNVAMKGQSKIGMLYKVCDLAAKIYRQSPGDNGY
jgi:hypothetical protein